jgi:hypothetical protein
MLDHVAVFIVVAAAKACQQDLDTPLVILDYVYEIKKLVAAQRDKICDNLKHQNEFALKSLNFWLWLLGSVVVLGLESNFVFLDFCQVVNLGQEPFFELRVLLIIKAIAFAGCLKRGHIHEIELKSA